MFKIGKTYRIKDLDGFLKHIDKPGILSNSQESSIVDLVTTREFSVTKMVGPIVIEFSTVEGSGFSFHSRNGTSLIFGDEFKYFEEMPPKLEINEPESKEAIVVMGGDVVITVKTETGRLQAIKMLEQLRFK